MLYNAVLHCTLLQSSRFTSLWHNAECTIVNCTVYRAYGSVLYFETYSRHCITVARLQYITTVYAILKSLFPFFFQKRPRNAFILYRSSIWSDLREKYEKPYKSQQELTKIAAQLWKQLPEEEKQKFR